MLKNDGDLLPLPRSGRKIALIGPFASGQHDLVGPWVVYGDDAKAVDLATGIRAALADKDSLVVVEGSGVEQPIAGGLHQALAAANAADIVILAIGESQGMSGEAQSRTEIVVPAPQQALAEAVASAGKPVVVVLKHGRALRLRARSPTPRRSSPPGSSAPRPAMPSPTCCSAPTALGPPAGELPAAFGPGALLLRAQADRAAQPAGPARAVQDAFPRHPQRRALPVRPRPDLRQDRICRARAQRFCAPRRAARSRSAQRSPTAAPAPPRRWCSSTSTTASRASPSRSATSRRSARSRWLRASRKSSASPCAPPTSLFWRRDNRPVVEPGTFDVWIAPSAESEGVHGTFELTA